MKSSYLLCLSLPVLILMVFLLMFLMYSPVSSRETFANACQKTLVNTMKSQLGALAIWQGYPASLIQCPQQYQGNQGVACSLQRPGTTNYDISNKCQGR